MSELIIKGLFVVAGLALSVLRVKKYADEVRAYRAQ